MLAMPPQADRKSQCAKSLLVLIQLGSLKAKGLTLPSTLFVYTPTAKGLAASLLVF